MNPLRALIIEDETAAAKNLKTLLSQVEPTLKVIDVIDTVVGSISWLQNNVRPDLIFMDIHLADGPAFKIFDQINVVVPIIFTTAYDRYALEAFKVNSIDYILKPIKASELQRALDKFKRLSISDKDDYIERTAKAVAAKNHTFLIPQRDKLVPLNIDEIAFCYTNQEKVMAFTHDKRELPLDKPLDVIVSMIPEQDFFRANRQFIVSRRSIRDISVWFGSRLSLNLNLETPEKIIISKARVPDFKRWFMGV